MQKFDNKTIRIAQERKRMSTFCISFQCQAICSILKCNLVLVPRAVMVKCDDDETFYTDIQNNFVPEATQYILVCIYEVNRNGGVPPKPPIMP